MAPLQLYLWHLMQALLCDWIAWAAQDFSGGKCDKLIDVWLAGAGLGGSVSCANILITET